MATTVLDLSVRHMLPGDRISTGEIVTAKPYRGVRTPKGQVNVHLIHKDGEVKRFWNPSTRVRVERQVG